MKNFSLMQLPWWPEAFADILAEIKYNDILWDIDRRRQSSNRKLMNTCAIIMRHRADEIFPDHETADDMLETVDTPLVNPFPKTMSHLKRVAVELNAKLGRAFFERLFPSAVVYPYAHLGTYYEKYQRFYVAMESPLGTCMRSGNEEVLMKPGELWWVNTREKHDTDNRSGDKSATHLIFDLQLGTARQ